MAGFVKGDIVVIPFPFSDLSGSKRRPALVLADLSGDDLILCQITSQHKKDVYAVPVTLADLKSGSLIKLSYVRPNRIFTADGNIIIRKVAALNEETLQKVVYKIIAILNA